MRRKVNKFVPTEQDYEQIKQAIIMNSASRFSYIVLWLSLLLLSIHSIVALKRMETINIIGVVVSITLLSFEIMFCFKTLLLKPEQFSYSEGKIIKKWQINSTLFDRTEHYYADIKLKDGRINKGIEINPEVFESNENFVIIAKRKNILYIVNRNAEV